MESKPLKHSESPKHTSASTPSQCPPPLLQSTQWLRERLNAFLQGILCHDVAPEARSIPPSNGGYSQAVIDTLDFLVLALRQYRNNYSRIAGLPNEVLSEIFYHVLSMDLIYAPPPFVPCSWKRYNRQIHQLRQVSSSWDSLICSDPKLWAFVSSNTPPWKIPVQVARSKALPLSLVLEAVTGYSSNSMFLKETLPIMHRIRSIQAFQGYNREIAQKVLAAGAPTLQILQIDGNQPRPEFGHFTQQSFQLQLCPIPSRLQVFPALRNLTLHMPTVSMKQVVKLLSHCPAVEKLEISGPQENNYGTTSPTLCHSLRHVILRDVSATAINTLLTHVDVSCCTSITVQLPQSRASPIIALLREHVIPTFVGSATAVEWQVRQQSFTCCTPTKVIKLEFNAWRRSATRTEIIRNFNSLFQNRPISLQCHLKGVDKTKSKWAARLQTPAERHEAGLQLDTLFDLSDIIESEGTTITEVRWANGKVEELQRFRLFLLAFDRDSATIRGEKIRRNLESLSTLVFDKCETNIGLLQGVIETRARTWFVERDRVHAAACINGIYVVDGDVVGGGGEDELLRDLGVRVHILANEEAGRIPALPDKVIVYR